MWGAKTHSIMQHGDTHEASRRDDPADGRTARIFDRAVEQDFPGSHSPQLVGPKTRCVMGTSSFRTLRVLYIGIRARRRSGRLGIRFPAGHIPAFTMSQPSWLVGYLLHTHALLIAALRSPGSLGGVPLPVADFRHVLTVPVDVLLVFDERVLNHLLQVAPLRAQMR